MVFVFKTNCLDTPFTYYIPRRIILYFSMSVPFPYSFLSRQGMIETINALAGAGKPFLFIIDYKAEKGFVLEEQQLDEQFVRFSLPAHTFGKQSNAVHGFSWKPLPVSKAVYAPKLDYVKTQIGLGNSFLTNLTQPTPVETSLSLSDLYDTGSALYKLWLRDKFTVLSPEIFVRIVDGRISSYPMKGTIDATLPDAESLILNDYKEKAEHATIVDLIRNDLSQIADGVEVERYRYIDRLTTNRTDLLQVSSEIAGWLPDDFASRLGTLLFSLLPAGSICGAPKPKTLEIIAGAEGYERGFYTGIFGWFDGRNLDSAVMIRFAEPLPDGLLFKSGGGITSQSELDKEYEELIQKVYVPVV